MCYCNEETMDHLLLHCHVAHSLWVRMLQVFGIQWVMPGSVDCLVSCWSFWLGKFSSDIWNMVPGWLMWAVWMERNWRSFEAKEKSIISYKLYARVLCLIGLGARALWLVLLSLSFFLLLVLSPKLLFLIFVVVCCFFLCSPSWTPYTCFIRSFFLINTILITYQKKNSFPSFYSLFFFLFFWD